MTPSDPITTAEVDDLTMCFEDGCTEPGHVRRVHEAGLDVERLARAIDEVTRADPTETQRDQDLTWGREWYGSPSELAERIALAYTEPVE